MSGSTFGVLMRVERRPYAVLAFFVRRENSFGKASANFDMDGAMSDGGDGIGMDSVVDIVLLGIGGSCCLAIRSRGGKCIFLERSNRLHIPILVTQTTKNFTMYLSDIYQVWNPKLQTVLNCHVHYHELNWG